MDPFFMLAVAGGIFAGVLLAAIVVLILHIRTNSQIDRMTYPAYEYAIKKAEHDADAVIQEAQQKAREIIANAEQTGQQSILTYNEEAKVIHQKYQEALTQQGTELSQKFNNIAEQETHKLHEAIGGMSQSLSSEHQRAMENLSRVTGSLESTSEKAQQQAERLLASLEERIGAVSAEIEGALKNAEAEGLNSIAGHFKALNKTVEEEVAAYSEGRKKLLDQHVERLVEDVVKRVLQAELPVSTHAALARKALEEAKAKHIL